LQNQLVSTALLSVSLTTCKPKATWSKSSQFIFRWRFAIQDNTKGARALSNNLTNLII